MIVEDFTAYFADLGQAGTLAGVAVVAATAVILRESPALPPLMQ